MSTRRSVGGREASYRITFAPAAPSSRWLARAPWALGLAAAALLLLATVGFGLWGPLAGHALAEYHYWKGKEAFRASESQIVVQRHFQEAVAADPADNRIRLDLARSYLDGEWYGGAIAQAQAVLHQRHTRQEASLAYIYQGYGHYMLGEGDRALGELALAVQYDPQNALAQSVLERLRLRGEVPRLEKATF